MAWTTEWVKYCSVVGCCEPIKGLGYCNRHYQLFKRNGKPEKLIKTARSHPLYILWFERKQNKLLCERWMTFKNFADDIGERPTTENIRLHRLDKTKLYGPDNWEWREHLKKEEDETAKDWWARKWSDARARNPDVEYDRNLKRNYGITLEEYLEKFQNQNGVCKICKQPETTINGHTKVVRRLAVDHCHKTNKVRDLLCTRCNTTIGSVDDDIELLEEMINYIKEHKE